MLDLEPIKKHQVNAAGNLPERLTPVDPEVGDLGLIYNEGGYCTACGNGHWKDHMPQCQIADLVDDVGALMTEVELLRKLVIDYSEMNSVISDPDYPAMCIDCWASGKPGELVHSASCSWRQACEYRDGK